MSTMKRGIRTQGDESSKEANESPFVKGRSLTEV